MEVSEVSEVAEEQEESLGEKKVVIEESELEKEERGKISVFSQEVLSSNYIFTSGDTFKEFLK